MDSNHPTPSSELTEVRFITTSPSGIQVNITHYLPTADKLYDAIIAIDSLLTSKGFKPFEPKKGFTPFPKKEKTYIEGRMCPIDGARLIAGETKTGKKFVQCENRKWDFTAKKATGCSFMEWDSPYSSSQQEVPVDSTVEPNGAFTITPPQRVALEKMVDQGLLSIDFQEIAAMSKNEAREIITKIVGK